MKTDLSISATYYFQIELTITNPSKIKVFIMQNYFYIFRKRGCFFDSNVL